MMSHMDVAVANDGEQALRWFEDLEADNSREFWQARKRDYWRQVRAPFDDMLGAIDRVLPATGLSHAGWRVYRPHQDTRFTPAGKPLKTFVAAVAETGAGGGLFVQLERRGLMAAVGMPYLAPDQLAAWRRAVADDTTGPEVAALVAAARESGLRVKGGRPDPLTTAPRGFRSDHPRIELLRWKGVEAFRWLGRDVWLGRDERADEVVLAWQTGAALLSWLEREIGPSSMPRPTR